MTRRLERRTAVLLLVGLLGLSRGYCARSLSEECLASLDRIIEAEQAVEDDGAGTRTYVLCPNTTFAVADAFNQDGSPSEGQFPLNIARSNIIVLCGMDGSSANNCVLTGGMEQLIFGDLFKSNNSVTNALVRGLTFTQAKTRNIVVRNNGQLSLVDCIFKVRRSLLPCFKLVKYASND
jgi:hypothetical protein